MDELTRLKIRNVELEAALNATKREAEALRLEMTHQQREIDSLRQFDLEMTRSEDLDYVLNLVLAWALSRLQADFALIARWDEHRQALECLKARGIQLYQDLQPGDTIHLPSHLTPQAHSTDDARELAIDQNGTRLVAQLRRADGVLVGIVLVQSHNQFAFSEAEYTFLRGLADRLTIALQTHVLLEKVQALHLYRKQLFRMLSHDLRQPLTVLMGYIQLMQLALSAGNIDVVEEYLKHVHTGAKDLNDLLEEVLLMERASDAARDAWKVISLQDIVRGALEKHQASAELHHHTLHLDIPDTPPMTILGSALELKEAAGNLISNAIKYTPEGGEIRVRVAADGDAHWCLTVEDNGYGIAPERQERLFESFYRAQEPGTEEIKGTGLGLSLVRTIVEKHDGEIFFESTPNEGSLFGFTLPMANAEPADGLS